MHLLLTTDLVGGVWDFCWTLAGEVVRPGHRVTVLAFGSPSATHRAQAEEIGATLLAAPLKLEWMPGSAADVRAACALTERLARELRPDLLHANQYALGAIDLDVPVVVTAHSDVLSWMKWVDGKDARFLAAAVSVSGGTDAWLSGYAALVRRGLERADAVVAVSGFLADEVQALYGLRRPIEVIYNGWPAEAALPPPVHRRARVTLLAGRAWDRAKNVQLASAAAQGWEPGRVLLAGAQHHPETGGAVELGPPIEPLGWLSRQALDRQLGLARAYLAPARYEPFGLLPLQAALAGCPLLLADIPSFRELWDGAAVFFRADDADDLRRHWARLLADDHLAATLAGRARRLALERYGIRRMADEYLDRYAGCLAAGRREPGGGEDQTLSRAPDSGPGRGASSHRPLTPSGGQVSG